MPTTPDQMDQVRSWMQEIDETCPACSNTRWITEELIAPPVRARAGLSENPPQIPSAELTCTNSGYVRRFSAAKMGLLD